MGYYANGIGFIELKEALSEEAFSETRDILSEAFEVDGVNKGDKAYFDIWASDKYYGETVEEVLNEVADRVSIAEGAIRYIGEDDAIWRYIWRDGRWQEEGGNIVYYDPDTVESQKDHAFYTLLDILADNMPDCDDEYADECRRNYDNALAEYREAEKTVKAGKA